MNKTLVNLNFNQAELLFSKRRKSEYVTNTLFYRGEHWQKGEGFIGETPPQGVGNRDEIMQTIERAFVSENVIKEVVDAHVNGAAGREFMWRFVPLDTQAETTEADAKLIEDAEDALTAWYNEYEIFNVLQKAVAVALLEERAVIRPFVLQDAVDDAGNLKAQGSLADALGLIRFEVLTSDKGGVFTDPNTLSRFGLYINRNISQQATVEITYLDEQNLTHLDLVEDKGLGAFVNLYFPNSLGGYFTEDHITQYAPASRAALNLGGRLMMYELRRDPLINEQIRSLQKSLNLTWTMMMRNINLAGSRERRFLNTSRPQKNVIVPDASAPDGYRIEKQDADLLVGSGVAGFLNGLPIYDKDTGKAIVGYTNPNVSVTDPISVTTFTQSRMEFYNAILAQAHQLHVTMSSEASASGKSRQEARAEFEKSLLKTKTALDAAGRWLMEVALKFAANASNQPEYLPFRCDFNSIADAGAPDFNERMQNRADFDAGAISLETLMSRNGVEDTDAEFSKIKQDENYILDQYKKRLDVINAGLQLLTIEEQVKMLFPLKTDAERAAYITQLKKESATLQNEQQQQQNAAQPNPSAAM